jgi:hypothetical protein
MIYLLSASKTRAGKTRKVLAKNIGKHLQEISIQQEGGANYKLSHRFLSSALIYFLPEFFFRSFSSGVFLPEFLYLDSMVISFSHNSK